MKTLGHKLREFFKQHQGQLQRSYPGLGEGRFLRESLIYFRLARQQTLLDEVEVAIHPEILQMWFDKILKGHPFAYLQGEAPFLFHEWQTTEATLIPRAESEQLAQLSQQYLHSHPLAKRVLDLCCGTGCLGLGLLTWCDRPLDVTLSDISPEALQVARLNAHYHRNAFPRESTITLHEGDRGGELPANSFDFIITNPPYIPRSEIGHSVHEQVQQFEPELALFIDDTDYDQWFSGLLENLALLLVAGGTFMMEGHEDHLEGLAHMIQHHPFDKVALKRDDTGRLRFLTAQRRAHG